MNMDWPPLCVQGYRVKRRVQKEMREKSKTS